MILLQNSAIDRKKKNKVEQICDSKDLGQLICEATIFQYTVCPDPNFKPSDWTILLRYMISIVYLISFNINKEVKFIIYHCGKSI